MPRLLTGTTESFIRDASPEDLEKLGIAVPFRFTMENPAPSYCPPESRQSAAAAVLRVEERDCVDCALDLVQRGRKKVGLLNMANEYNCGGGFERVQGSQEEYLFRRTSIAVSLWPHRRVDDHRWSYGSRALPSPNADTSFYPLTECGGIFSPFVEIIATPELFYLPVEARPKEKQLCDKIAGLTVAAQDLRFYALHNIGKNVKFSHDVTRQKLRTCLHMAATNGCDSLVLGALGCGAFYNPPLEMAMLFGELLKEGGEFAHAFDEVVFAVIYSNRNLEAFLQVFPPSEGTSPSDA